MRYGISTRSAKRSNYSKSKKYTPKPVKKIIKSAVKSNFNKKVMSIVHKNEETKQSNPQAVIDEPIIPFLGSTPPTLVDLTTVFNSIQLGTGQGSRIGNQIDNVKVTIKGSIVNMVTTNRPCMVKMVVFKDKKNLVGSLTPPTAETNLSDFFQWGNGTVEPQNFALDMVRFFNKDRYIIYATRMFKLASSTSTTNPNNDFNVQKYFRIDLSKHISKVRYSETGSVSPSPVLVTPQNLWVTFLVCYADGTVITETPANYPDIQVTFDAICTYKDS